MTPRPPARSGCRTAARRRGRGVPTLCAAVLGILAMTACSGSDPSAAAPTTAPPEADAGAPGPVASATPEAALATPTPTPTPTTETPSAVSMDVDRADPAVFDHEQVRPVIVEETGTERYGDAALTRIQFPSQDGGMASGFMALPADPASDVGILWAHGMPGDGRDSFAPMAVFACAGATNITVNAPYARSPAARADGAVTDPSAPLTFTATDRDEQIQLIRDMRRAIDVLQDRGLARIGFGGISYGAAMGAALIGVEDRIEAAKLTLGNGGLVERHLDEDGTPTVQLDDLTAEEVEAWVQAMLPIEPVRFIADSDAAILFLNGRNDPIIPVPEAERFHAAAPDAEVRWTGAGHDVSFEDFLFHNEWLGTRLGMDAERLEACARQLFPGGW